MLADNIYHKKLVSITGVYSYAFVGLSRSNSIGRSG